MIVHDASETGTAISLTRADLQGDYDFIPTTSKTEMDKKQQMQEDTQFLQAMMSIPPGLLGGKQYNFAKHIEEISLPMRGQKNGKDYLIDMPVDPMMLEQGRPVGKPSQFIPGGPQAPSGPSQPPMPQTPQQMLAMRAGERTQATQGLQ